MYLTHTDEYDYILIDIEANSLTPDKIHCICVMDYHTKEEQEFRPHQMEEFRQYAIKKIKNPKTRWVAHNGTSFDVPVLNRLLSLFIPSNTVIDTLILSYLYHPHMPGGHSLAAWGERLKFPKDDYNGGWEEFSEEMLKYCRQDVKVLDKLFEKLPARMLIKGYSEQSCMIEHNIRRIIDVQQNNGVKFNLREASILLADLRSRKAKLEERIHTVFPPELIPLRTYKYKLRQNKTPYQSYHNHVAKYPKLTWNNSRSEYTIWDYQSFNIGSPTQRVKRLLDMGWKPTEFTPRTKKGGGGNPKVTEDALLAFAEESNTPEVEFIAEHMLYTARISTLEEWIKHTDKLTERIHGTIYSCGAGTRRMRHQKPNTANICGVDKPFGVELRSFWTVEKGKVLVGIDAKGLEGRVLMHYLNNSAAIEVFTSGDIHQMNSDSITAAVGFLVDRRTTKTLYYAFLYGATDRKLGSIVGKNAKVGALIRAAMIDNVPGLRELTESIEKEYKKNGGRLQTIDDGYVVCPSPHAALNYKCQSAGAILMKLASIYMDERVFHSKAIKVLDVHDEVQWECDPDYAEDLGELYCQCIRDAGVALNFNVDMDGDYNVGNNWAETH